MSEITEFDNIRLIKRDELTLLIQEMEFLLVTHPPKNELFEVMIITTIRRLYDSKIRPLPPATWLYEDLRKYLESNVERYNLLLDAFKDNLGQVRFCDEYFNYLCCVLNPKKLTEMGVHELTNYWQSTNNIMLYETDLTSLYGAKLQLYMDMYTKTYYEVHPFTGSLIREISKDQFDYLKTNPPEWTPSPHKLWVLPEQSK